MASTAVTDTDRPTPAGAPQVLADLQRVRTATLELVAHIDTPDLERVHSPIMSPLAWDLGHIAAYEDLWLAHRHGALPLLRPELADLYDAFETPRAIRGEIDALGADDARSYMREVRERTAEVLADRGIGDGFVCEMVLRHELQHAETMRQTMAIADLTSPADRERAGRPVCAPGDGEEWLEIPAGSFEMGARDASFSYDNERPRHGERTGAYRIGRFPVSCERWLGFSEAGGYERREWWSPEGWEWKREQQIEMHPAIAEAHPQAPACHLSWFEAEAFARASGARLPSETEWEKAATYLPEGHDGGRAEGRGEVWEWTVSTFGGYPGFVAHPYREYSEVFFGERYRVLRGGSWATSPRVATATFRNWDLPQRRQIFAGVRLASDAA